MIPRSMMLSLLLLVGSIAAAASGPQVLNVNNGPEPDSVDPHLTTTVDGRNLALQLFEGLVAPDPKNADGVVPGVAERWTVSPDGKTYTFYLRKNAQWSDGSPLTAEDFLYSWRRVADPATASPNAERFNYIKNGAAFFSKKITDPNQLGFKMLSPTTFQVELEGPFPPFLQLISQPTFAPVKKEVLEKFGDRWTRPENFVGNGPFVLTEWRFNDRLVLVKNAHYWDVKNVKLDQINFLSIEDLETVFKRYEIGEIDFTYEPPEGKVVSLRGRPDFHESTAFGLYYYVFNTKLPALQDIRVRRALSLAVDRKTIVEKILRSGERTAGGWIPPGIHGYPTRRLVDFNPTEAKRLLAAAGYPNGQGFPTLTLIYNIKEHHRLIAEAIQQMWRTTLGLHVELQNHEWKIHTAALLNHNFDIARLGGSGEYIYPTTMLENLTTTAPRNYSQWSNTEFDRLWEEANREPKLQKQLTMYAEMEKILAQEMPELPIYYYTNYWLAKPYVKGVVFTPTRVLLLKYASIQK